MTVLPFVPRNSAETSFRPPSGGSDPVPITGALMTPSGSPGRLVGTYRLLKVVVDGDQLAAAGITSGRLLDGHGRTIGTGSRRHTVAADLDTSRIPLRVLLGPFDVSLMGFVVTIGEFSVQLPQNDVTLREL